MLKNYENWANPLLQDLCITIIANGAVLSGGGRDVEGGVRASKGGGGGALGVNRGRNSAAAQL